MMAFKQREYKKWVKFFHQMVFENGSNPYLLKTFIKELADDEDYEACKACNDIFDEWYAIHKMSEKETESYLKNYYNNHPVYGQSKRNL